MKKILFIFILLVTFCLSPITAARIYAAENFTTAYDVTYAIDGVGITHVTMLVKLTNTSSQYFASSYKVHLGFDDVENVSVKDPKGTITPQVAKTNEGHTIAVTFKEKVVGKGKTLPFTVTFDTKDVALKRGSAWSIMIPGIADQQDFSDFHVQIEVPDSFGKPTFIKPDPGTSTLSFTKQQLGTGGISIAFGQKQAYDFYLTYHLKNENIFPIRTEIALPPDTNYQSVYYTSIEPPPVNVTTDADGNWLAEYQLKPSESVEIVARGKASISYKPSPEKVSSETLQKYLKADKHWQVQEPELKKLAEKLKTPEAIYQYVIDNLHYDFSRVTDSEQRLGALEVYRNPTSAVCLEFTDLFIALARAAGIPSREVNGYAYTENDRQRPLSLVKDILHAWPEYYDQKQGTWVMVDPTWGNTTHGIDYFTVFDFDHFAFVIKGTDSEYPVPAGGYKSDAAVEGKDVHVEFGQEGSVPDESFRLEPDFPETTFSFLPIFGTIRVKNTSAGVSKPHELTITSQTLAPVSEVLTVPEIPPYGYIDMPVRFRYHPDLTNTTHTFTIQFNSQRIQGSLITGLFVIPDWRIIGGLIGISVISILIITLKSGRLPFSRR